MGVYDGKQFGDWTVINSDYSDYWECRCSCGIVRDVNRRRLISGLTTSCGHSRNEKLSLGDLVGNTFKDITVIKSLGRGRYECICKCGAVKAMAGNDIRRGRGIRCNHNDQAKYDSYIGKKFGELEVIGTKGAKAICKCSCGNTIEYYISGLIQGTKRSCGCIRGRKSKLLEGKTIGYLHLDKYLGAGEYECTCICGNKTIWKTGNLNQSANHSCGCKMRYEMSIKKDISNNKERSEEQLRAIESKENLENFINNKLGNNRVPIVELAKQLGISRSNAKLYIDRFDLNSRIADMTFYSNDEKELFEFISKYCSDIVQHERTVAKPYEIDMFIPSKRIGIEYNGNYWHSEINRESEYHQKKTLCCFRNNIRLIHIFEYDWKNNKEKIQNFLIDSLYDKEVIYARNLNCTVISVDEKKEFLDKYHLQGNDKSTIAYGLRLNNELVAVMTLGKPRFNTEFQYEIIRVCYKNGLNIVGGLEKLFKNFLREYDPSSVISYSDISKFTGLSYVRLGFKMEEVTKPNYVWVGLDNNDVKSRYMTQKKELLKEGLGIEGETEDEIMHSLGYVKIYNSGNAKYTWRKPKNA